MRNVLSEDRLVFDTVITTYTYGKNGDFFYRLNIDERYTKLAKEVEIIQSELFLGVIINAENSEPLCFHSKFKSDNSGNTLFCEVKFI